MEEMSKKEAEVNFSSPVEEAKYWREKSEHKVKEYRSLSNRLQMENDQLKSKLEQCHREYHFQEYACLT